MFSSLEALAHSNSHYLVPNRGQWPEEAIARAQIEGADLFITKFGFRIRLWDQKKINETHESRNFENPLSSFAFDLTFIDGDFSRPVFSDFGHFPINFLIGNEASRWATNILPAKQVVFKSVYQGIDLKIYFEGEAFKYEFIVHPKANSKLIRWKVSKGVSTKLSGNNLLYKTPLGTFSDIDLDVFTKSEGKQFKVGASYNKFKDQFSFTLDSYNIDDTLVIDPVLIFGTFSGSTSDNWGFTATSDDLGNGYLGGIVRNSGYPVTIGAIDTSFNGGDWDISLSKFSEDGSQLLYSTYLGGNLAEYPMSLVVNSFGELFILAKTLSLDFPVSASAYDQTHNGLFDLVVTRLNPSGSTIVASTFIGGSANDGHNRLLANNRYLPDTTSLEYNYGDDSRGDILIDSLGFVFIASNTYSSDFPTSGTAQSTHSGQSDAVVLKLNANLSSLIWSSLLGGGAHDAAYSLTFRSNSNVLYIAGGTRSQNFLSSSNVNTGFDLTHNGNTDGFVVGLNLSNGQLLYRSFIGTTSYDQAYLIYADNFDGIYVTGQSRGSIPVFPATVYRNTGGKIFVQKYNSRLDTLQLSTVFGPSTTSPSLVPTAMLVDLCNRIYVAGWGGSANSISGPLGNWPITNDAFRQNTDGSDFYFMVLESDLRSLIYSTFFGGSAAEHVDGGTSRFNRNGVIYQAVCAGCGGSSSFPVTANAWSSTNNSPNCNAALFKFDLETSVPVAQFSTQYPDTPVCALIPVQFRSTGTIAADYFWDFGLPGATSRMQNPSFTYTIPGLYTITLIVTNCAGSDTIVGRVEVLSPATISSPRNQKVCVNDTLQLSLLGGFGYRWIPDAILLDTIGNSPRVKGITSRWLYVYISNAAGCESLDSVFIQVIGLRNVVADTISFCLGKSTTIQPRISNEVTSWFWVAHPLITNPLLLNQTIFTLSTTKLYLVTNDTNGCSNLDSTVINPIVTVRISAGPDKLVCLDEQVILTAAGASRYLWSNGDTTNSITVPFANAATYWVTGFEDSCQSLPDTVRVIQNIIEASFKVEPDTAYAPSSVQFINLSTGEGINTFRWNFGDGGTSTLNNPSYIYRNPGRYSVTLETINSISGCSDSMIYNYVFVDSILFLLPNTFSPNNDGLNDYFFGVQRNFESFRIIIYNRWGELIFESNDPAFTWDGKLKGKYLSSGIYPYVVTAVGKNRKPYQFAGEVKLIR